MNQNANNSRVINWINDCVLSSEIVNCSCQKCTATNINRLVKQVRHLQSISNIAEKRYKVMKTKQTKFAANKCCFDIRSELSKRLEQLLFVGFIFDSPGTTKQSLELLESNKVCIQLVIKRFNN